MLSPETSEPHPEEPPQLSPLVESLFGLTLISATLILLFDLLIFGIGLLSWLPDREYDRVALAIRGGTPFVVLAMVLGNAAFGIRRLHRWAWWLGLAGSLGPAA